MGRVSCDFLLIEIKRFSSNNYWDQLLIDLREQGKSGLNGLEIDAERREKREGNEFVRQTCKKGNQDDSYQ